MSKDLVHQKYFWVLHGIAVRLLQHKNPDYLLLKQVLYYLENTWFHILFILLFLFFLLLFTFSFCFLLLMLFYQLFHLLLLQNPYYCLSVLSCQCCNFNWNTWNRQQRLGTAIISRARFEVTSDSEAQKAPKLCQAAWLEASAPAPCCSTAQHSSRAAPLGALLPDTQAFQSPGCSLASGAGQQGPPAWTKLAECLLG